MRGKKKKKDGSSVPANMKFFKNDSNFLLRFFNQGYYLFAIVKKFTFKILWVGSCISLMFLLPTALEIYTE